MEDFGEEVDGVASEFSVRPSPVTLFDQKPRVLFESKGGVGVVSRHSTNEYFSTEDYPLTRLAEGRKNR